MTNETFHIRHGVPTDASAIAALQDRVWQETYKGLISDDLIQAHATHTGPALWERVLARPTRPVYVAEAPNGAMIAMASGDVAKTAEKTFIACDGWLLSLYVLQASQKQGLGGKLLYAVAQDLFAQGCRTMGVHVLESNPAGAFYERMGGREAARGPVDLHGGVVREVSFVFDLPLSPPASLS